MQQSLTILQTNPTAFTQILTSVDKAQKSIIVSLYSLHADTVGLRLLSALEAAAARGLEVLVMLDAIGSMSLSKEMIERLHKAPLHFRFFNPLALKKGFYMGRRLHQKLIVIDSQKLWLGGANIGDPYFGTLLNSPNWLDFVVELQHPATHSMHVYLQALFYKRPFSRNQKRISKRAFTYGTANLRFKINDWWKGYLQITDSYRKAIRSSKQSILCMHSYFFPSTRMLRLLKKQARLGKRVVLILPGMSDMRLQQYATESLYLELLEANIELYEWRISVLHSKLLLVDASYISLGSYNLHFTSRFFNLEANLEINSQEQGQALEHRITTEILPQCLKVTKDLYNLQRASWFRRFTRLYSYVLMRVLHLVFVREATKKR